VRLYSEGIRQFLDGRPEFTVTGTVGCAADVLDRLSQSPADVLVLDQALPGGLELLHKLQRLPSPIRVVTLGEPEQEESLLIWAEAGVAGFVPRDATVEALRNTILSAACGELICSARMAGTLLQRLQQLAQAAPERQPRLALTAREAEIAALLEQGLSNKELAVRLGIEVATVKNHMHNLLEKLQVHRRAEAVSRLRGRDPRRPTPIPFRR
jgi:DNA-binding NarL/FixJ family response regulator